MGRFRRYRTAISRHHRSGGFGIHSPFAFNFVLRVLGEKWPYYGYALISDVRSAVVEVMRREKRHPRVISAKNAKMLFRIANYFNPGHMLVIGTNYGISVVSVMLPSSKSTVHLYEPNIGKYPVVGNVLEPFLDGIESYDNLSLCVKEYGEQLADADKPFLLVNDIPANSDFEGVRDAVFAAIDRDGVVLLRNMEKSDEMAQLWAETQAHMTVGQTFTNEKTAVVVANPKLPLQHFFLWF